MKRSSALSLLLVVACASASWADIVHLKDGRVLEGETEWTDAGLRIRLGQGELIVPKADVVEVIERDTPGEALAKRRAALDPKDVDGVLSLSAFALEHELEAEARSLLLYAAALAPDRAEVRQGLEALDFHLEGGVWVAPEDWYPAHGYVPWRGRWITAEEAARQEAQRERRAARSDLREAEQDLKAAARELKRAEEELSAAEREVDTGRARVEHYQGEVQRIITLVEHARSEVRQASQLLAELERDRLLAVRTYDLWVGSPCACRPRACQCGWERQRLLYLNACALYDGQVTNARRALRRAEERLASHQADLERAEQLLQQAQRKLVQDERGLIQAEQAHLEASARADAAERARDDAQLRLDDAQAPPPAPQPSDAALHYPERPLLSAAIQAYRQPALDDDGRAEALGELERSLAAGPQSARAVLTRFVHALAGAAPDEVRAALARLRLRLAGETRETFERVFGALQAVDALARVAAAQANHRAEHGTWATAQRQLIVPMAGRFGPAEGYTIELVGDADGWLAVARPRHLGWPTLARGSVGGTVARLDPIPLDLAVGVPATLEPLPPLE